MTRVARHSLRPRRTADQPPLNRQWRRALARELARLQPAIAASAAACGAERYRKHFDSYAHGCLLLFAGLTGLSLRQSYAAFSLCPGLVGLSGLGTDDPDRLAVCFSHLADSNTTRPAAVLRGVLPGLLQRLQRAGPPRDHRLPVELRILDATFLRLSMTRCGWLPNRGGCDGPGMRLQVLFTPALDRPAPVALTDTRTNDRQTLDQLLADPLQRAALQEQTLVVDLGYYAHRHFAEVLAAGGHLVSRVHPQARVTVTAQHPVQTALPTVGPPGRITVVSDATITLGSPHNRTGAVLAGLRRVEATVQPHQRARGPRATPVTYLLVTDRFDLPADEVVQLYLWRWEIEAFFRWLKRVLGLALRLLGYSRNAVELSVWLALVVHLLVVLISRAVGNRQRSLTVLTQLRLVLGQLRASDLAAADDLDRQAGQAQLPGLAAAPT